MKVVIRSLFIAALLVGGLAYHAAAQVVTNDVLFVKFGGTGVVQDPTTPNTLDLVKVTDAKIVNLARGRDPDATVPTNEALVLVVPRDGTDIEMDVVDKSTTNSLAQVATTHSLDGTQGAKGGVAILNLEMNTSGVSSNRIASGNLYLSIKYSQLPGGTLTKLAAAVTGTLNVTARGEDSTVLLPNARLGSTGAPITIITP